MSETKQNTLPKSKILKGHTSGVNHIAITSDGRRAVSCSHDKTVRVWDLESGKCTAVLEGHTDSIWGVAITSDGRRAVSGSFDRTVRVWDLESGKCTAVLEGHKERIRGVAITPDGHRAVSTSYDRTVRVWDLESGKCTAVLEGHAGWLFGIAITSDGRRAVFGSDDRTVHVWDLESGKCTAVLEGHKERIRGVAITSDGRRAVSGSDDRTVRVWDLESGKCTAVLEGHTRSIWGVAITSDGRRAVSGSDDRTVRVWDLESGKCTAVLEGHIQLVFGIAITSDGRRAVSCSHDKTVRVWDLPPIEETSSQQTSLSPQTSRTKYTNAKVLLVGESGVGKSGLAIRLTENKFEATVSTDAVWATQLNLPHDVNTEDTEREIWLWDFAGQSDYRLIHQLFMDETSMAVLVFNPQTDNPYEGLGQWDRALQQAARRSYKKLLVAGRCDRGGMMVSRESLDQFIKERGFDGYIETSALTGDGCESLREAIIQNIPWNEIPWTSSPRIFKILKEEIIKLKDEGNVLLRMVELETLLRTRLAKEEFTIEELRAVVSLLASPGVVWQLEFGDFVLLQPERINSYAAAVIRSVRAHTDEIGCIDEKRVLDGDIDYQDMKRLPRDEEEIVLRAMHQTFVDHGLCLREHADKETLLIFPSYFKRERPEMGDHPAPLVTYQFSGALDEIYATLVVRLHYTNAFEKDQLWRFAADFKTSEEKRVGLMMQKKHEGAAEITAYFEPSIPDDTKVMFIRYIHDHLNNKAIETTRTRHYVCPHCHTPLENYTAIKKRLEQNEKDIGCGYCEKRVVLFDLIEQKFASEEFQRKSREMDEEASEGIDNESRELILVGHAFSIAGEAGQIFRGYTNSDHGIDGEIEFKNKKGEASGARVYLQLKSGDSYLQTRKSDDKEIFRIKKPRWAEYWQSQAYPVMLVIRTSDKVIRWMNVTDYLKEYLKKYGKNAKQIIFDGEPFTAKSLTKMRDRMLVQQKS